MKSLLLFALIALPVFAKPGMGLRASTAENIERAALRYFLENAHPATGLVRDRAENFRPTPAENRVASLASTGFGLAVISHASTRGWVRPEDARAYALKTLRFCRDHVPRHRGWFLHFADWETGERAWRSEYSTIDTALFLAGALYAGQLFGGEVRELASQLYRAVDFPAFLTDEGQRRGKLTLSLSWTPEHGYVPYQWEVYAEQLILLVLGMGHPTAPLPAEAWRAWSRDYSRVPGQGRVMGAGMPLFIHQYSQLFVDFRGFRDGHGNYFTNGAAATRLHRQNGVDGFWGWSAGDSARGYEVPDLRRHDGTVCIGCAVASAMFLPGTVLADVEAWLAGPHKERIWGRYGLVDGLDPRAGWYAPMVIGITVGPEYLSIANTRETSSIWKTFMAIPEIRRGLERAIKR